MRWTTITALSYTMWLIPAMRPSLLIAFKVKIHCLSRREGAEWRKHNGERSRRFQYIYVINRGGSTTFDNGFLAYKLAWFAEAEASLHRMYKYVGQSCITISRRSYLKHECHLSVLEASTHRRWGRQQSWTTCELGRDG